MGGEGSTQQMISVIKSNKALVGTRDHFFSRKRNFKGLREAYRMAEERLAAGPNATKAELRLIRERIIKEQQIKAYKIGFAMLAISISVVLVLVFISA